VIILVRITSGIIFSPFLIRILIPYIYYIKIIKIIRMGLEGIPESALATEQADETF